MIVKLLTEHHLESLSVKGGCRDSCQNATLLEISCIGSYDTNDHDDVDFVIDEIWAQQLHFPCGVY